MRIQCTQHTKIGTGARGDLTILPNLPSGPLPAHFSGTTPDAFLSANSCPALRPGSVVRSAHLSDAFLTKGQCASQGLKEDKEERAIRPDGGSCCGTLCPEPPALQLGENASCTQRARESECLCGRNAEVCGVGNPTCGPRIEDKEEGRDAKSAKRPDSEEHPDCGERHNLSPHATHINPTGPWTPHTGCGQTDRGGWHGFTEFSEEALPEFGGEHGRCDARGTVSPDGAPRACPHGPVQCQAHDCSHWLWMRSNA